jgi:hypothetical protein
VAACSSDSPSDVYHDTSSSFANVHPPRASGRILRPEWRESKR